MTLKAIKDNYHVTKLNNDFHLFSLTEKGRLMPIKYICTVHKHNSTEFYVTGFEPTNNFNELKNQIQNKIESYQYCSEFYNPMYRNGTFEEFVIHDYMLNTLNFKSKGTESYFLAEPNLYNFINNEIHITISGLSSFNDIPEEVNIKLWINNHSCINHNCKRNVDDIKRGVEGILKPLMVTDSVSLLLKAEKMTNFSDVDITLKKLEQSLDISDISIKEHMKKMLLEMAEKL